MGDVDNISGPILTNGLAPARTRRLAVVHHSHDILVDTNGNSGRLARLSEASLDDPAMDKEENVSEIDENSVNNIEKHEALIFQQIQALIKNVQVSDSLADYVNRECLGGVDVNANLKFRHRRKSCFSPSTGSGLSNIMENTAGTARRKSVLEQKSLSLPRTSVTSNEQSMHFDENRNPLHQGKRRRSSVVNPAGGRRISVVSSSGPRSRRNSVQHVDGSAMTTTGRRNSVSTTWTRRVSLVNAYNNSAFSPDRKINSCSNNTYGQPEGNSLLPQRRRSSVKTPCFPVMKVVCVHKRFQRLHRRRKRQERAQVSVADVKSAFKDIRKAQNNGSSDSGECSEVETNVVNNTNFATDGERNSFSNDENLDTCEAGNSKCISEPHEGRVEDPESLETGDTSQGPVPAPRRKTSIQVRTWELSRSLRQRRREKRKGCNESNLI
ncbi:uncharacterized protein LOC128232667 [Mya arenaria]|uniref:uncharacterized protein LOC128232667 n=1 Tax=Mya arenaria TaxID=6604 RepID=UPI0022E8DB7D|nr:uncharacterized protein LOC128232667 [Mya arenaria]XP_052802319.1 uncharacterized protein LOC128232667 [Mya arenaria]XP_052802320.1 uncharacterized protein LOC128232667 [Mya arenaria]